MSESAIAEEVEKRLAQFAHQPAVLIRDSERGVLGDAAGNDGVASSGKGRIHLFRDGLSGRAAVVRTLWHELLHYGLRRFLSKEQCIAEMYRLYLRDAWVRKQANAWLETDEAKAAKQEGSSYPPRPADGPRTERAPHRSGLRGLRSTIADVPPPATHATPLCSSATSGLGASPVVATPMGIRDELSPKVVTRLDRLLARYLDGDFDNDPLGPQERMHLEMDTLEQVPDEGAALLSLGNPTNAGGVDLAAVDGVIARVLAAKKGWDVEVVGFESFGSLPANVQESAIANYYGEEEARNAKGIVHGEKVYLIAARNESEADRTRGVTKGHARRDAQGYPPGSAPGKSLHSVV